MRVPGPPIEGRAFGEKLSILRRLGTAKRDYGRNFSIVLPLPEEKEYSVRVRHSMDTSDHVSGMKE